MIIYLPLEHLEERYTPMFNDAFYKKSDYFLYPEFNYPSNIESGEFLDINKTIIFKSKQLQMISEMFYDKRISDGDVFIVSDIFFPGIESIRYMSELQNIKVFIFGFNHAGRSDPTDFVKKLGFWSDHSERGYHSICDGIFFGSDFHSKRTSDYFKIAPSKCFDTGMIWNSEFVNNIYNNKNKNEKEDFVIWPHRMSEEKGFSDFLKIANNNPDTKYLITSSGRRQNVHLPSNVDYQWECLL